METEPRDDGSSHPPRGIEAWITAVLILIVLIIALALTLGQGMIQRNRKPPAGPSPPSPIATPPVPMEPAALAALEKYFEAPDTASKSQLVRDPTRVRRLMEDHHDRRNHPYQTLGRVSPGHATLLGTTPAVLFQIEPFSGPRYPVAMVWDGQRFAVDWESLTAYGTLDWSEFIERRPTTIEALRVYLSHSPEPENFPSMPESFVSFQIEHRDDPQPIVCIASREVAAVLHPMAGNPRTPVTLEMTWTPIGPGGTKVSRIIRLVTPGWSH